jgi:iron complex transport system permease protein
MGSYVSKARPSQIPEGSARARRFYAYVFLLVLSSLILVAGARVGRVSTTDAGLAETFLTLRLYRTLVGFGVGACLAVGGVVVQGLFRNDLASPSVLGTTASGSVGGQIALVSFQWLLAGVAPAWLRAEMFVPLGCILGALAGLVVLLMIHRVSGDVLMLLLGGFLISSLFISVGAFLTTMAQDSWELGRALITFTLGDLAGTGARQVALVSALGGIGIGFSWYWGHALDMMLSGEDEATSLGLNVAQVKRWAIVWTAVLTAAAVSVAGSVGFVGLIVPHALRPWVGVRHRTLIPAAVLGGGCFVVFCDLLCRLLPSQSELPLGVVTGLFGAPVFLGLLLRSQRAEQS